MHFPLPNLIRNDLSLGRGPVPSLGENLGLHTGKRSWLPKLVRVGGENGFFQTALGKERGYNDAKALSFTEHQNVLATVLNPSQAWSLVLPTASLAVSFYTYFTYRNSEATLWCTAELGHVPVISLPPALPGGLMRVTASRTRRD